MFNEFAVLGKILPIGTASLLMSWASYPPSSEIAKSGVWRIKPRLRQKEPASRVKVPAFRVKVPILRVKIPVCRVKVLNSPGEGIDSPGEGAKFAG